MTRSLNLVGRKFERLIVSRRPDDPAWKSGEGACGMAVEIMKGEANEIAGLQFDLTMKSLDNSKLKIKNKEMNDAMIEEGMIDG